MAEVKKFRPVGMDSFANWWDTLWHPSSLTELAVLALCVALAWSLCVLARRTLAGATAAGAPQQPSAPVLFGRRIFDGVLFPLLLLLITYVARAALATVLSVAVFQIAVPLALALVVIRLGVKVLQAAFHNAPWVRVMERSISWMVWMAMALWASGLLPVLLEELDQIQWSFGKTTLSVRTLLEGAITAGLVLLLTLWLSSAIESRLLKNAQGSELSLRKMLSNAVRALLVFVGLLMALSSVGIDLTALSVLGGAIGVGIGFGLQKLAANYVSGFVILAERSMRIGDSIKVDGFEGRVTDIRARYSVVRSLGGRESIVPNEMLIINRVENLSLADTRVWQSTTVAVGYDSDVDHVMALLLQAAKAQPRVLQDPAPSVNLAAFGADGLEFRVGYWLGDPENGVDGLRSDINRAILKSLRAHDIDIPFPQRVLHLRGAAAATATAGPPPHSTPDSA